MYNPVQKASLWSKCPLPDRRHYSVNFLSHSQIDGWDVPNNYNSPPINGQITILLYDGLLLCGFNVAITGLIQLDH